MTEDQRLDLLADVETRVNLLLATCPEMAQREANAAHVLQAPTAHLLAQVEPHRGAELVEQQQRRLLRTLTPEQLAEVDRALEVDLLRRERGEVR